MKLSIHFRKKVTEYVAYSEKTLAHYLDQIGAIAYIIDGKVVHAF